jgi:protein PhnA
MQLMIWIPIKNHHHWIRDYAYTHKYGIITLHKRYRITPMSLLPNCPKCNSEYTYEDALLLICPECMHEWSKEDQDNPHHVKIFKDANGNLLQDGDSVTVIKDLKVKGSSLVVKVGTKVKNIRLVEGDHDIDCKIDGIGPMKLKSQFVKKI